MGIGVYRHNHQNIALTPHHTINVQKKVPVYKGPGKSNQHQIKILTAAFKKHHINPYIEDFDDGYIVMPMNNNYEDHLINSVRNHDHDHFIQRKVIPTVIKISKQTHTKINFKTSASNSNLVVIANGGKVSWSILKNK